MIYILLDIFNYKQLVKINPEFDDRLQACYQRLSNDFQCLLLKQWETRTLFSLSLPKNQESAHLLKCLVYLTNFLDEEAEELFGYNLLFHTSPDAKIDLIQKTLSAKLFSLEEDNSVWCDEEIMNRFKDNLSFENHNNLWKIVNILDNAIVENTPTGKNLVAWHRESILQELLNELVPLLNTSESGLILLSAEGYGTEQVINRITKQIMGEKWVPPIIVYAPYAGYAQGYPLIESIDSNLLSILPSYLTKEEQVLWNSRLQVLNYFKLGTTEQKCFDNLLEDIYLFYNLYLAAYIRLMEEKYLPAFFICQDLEKQSPQVIKALIRILKDFLKKPAFIPILIAREEETISKFKNLNLKRMDIPPVSWKEIKSLSTALYPGLTLSRPTLKKLSELAGGKVIFIMYYLWYLENEGKIKLKDGIYTWVSREEKYFQLTKNVKLVSWSILKQLTNIKKEILYIIYLANGLLHKEELLQFFVTHGFEEHAVQQGLKLLVNYGFLSEQDPPRPQITFLIKKLEAALKQRVLILKDDFIDFIKNEWQAARLKADIPLYYFFIRHNDLEIASQILPVIIKNKLDENDLTGVLPFLDLEKCKLDSCTNPETKKILSAVIANGQLRYYLLCKKTNEAQQLVTELENKLLYLKPSPESACILLNLASYQLSLGNPKDALKKLKEALLKIQDSGLTASETRIYLEIACVTVAEGRFDEALDYLNIAERLCTPYSFERLLCLIIKSISTFILGKMSRLHALLEDGIRIAGQIGRREWELFFYFLKGRLYFLLGEYEKACGYFLIGLNMIEMYKLKAASTLFYIWLARAHIYKGNIEAGLSILKNYTSHKEALYYLAEGYYFSEQVTTALDYLQKALTSKLETNWLTPESLAWESSCGLVEGFCLPADKKEFIIQRHIRTFRAYLLSQIADKQPEYKEFKLLTVSCNLPGSDMYNSFYNLLYYLALPKFRPKNQDIADRLTILNKALALLQEQTNRLDFHLDKTLFLNNNYWNKKLVVEAKANNLL